MEGYTRADKNYHVTVSMVLSVARRALEIFESSEVPEKRQLLKYLLQNSRLEGEKLIFELKSPFDTIVSIKDSPMGCPALDVFRTLNWGEIRRELEKARLTLS